MVLQCYCSAMLGSYDVVKFNSVTDRLTYKATTRGPSGPKNIGHGLEGWV